MPRYCNRHNSGLPTRCRTRHHNETPSEHPPVQGSGWDESRRCPAGIQNHCGAAIAAVVRARLSGLRAGRRSTSATARPTAVAIVVRDGALRVTSTAPSRLRDRPGVWRVFRVGAGERVPVVRWPTASRTAVARLRRAGAPWGVAAPPYPRTTHPASPVRFRSNVVPLRKGFPLMSEEINQFCSTCNEIDFDGWSVGWGGERRRVRQH